MSPVQQEAGMPLGVNGYMAASDGMMRGPPPAVRSDLNPAPDRNVAFPQAVTIVSHHPYECNHRVQFDYGAPQQQWQREADEQGVASLRPSGIGGWHGISEASRLQAQHMVDGDKPYAKL